MRKRFTDRNNHFGISEVTFIARICFAISAINFTIFDMVYQLGPKNCFAISDLTLYPRGPSVVPQVRGPPGPNPTALYLTFFSFFFSQRMIFVGTNKSACFIWHFVISVFDCIRIAIK